MFTGEKLNAFSLGLAVRQGNTFIILIQCGTGSPAPYSKAEKKKTYRSERKRENFSSLQMA